MALVVYFGFFNEEYLIALVDFIVALRRTKGRRRRTLRSPSPPSSGLHLLTPGGVRCGGAYWLPRAWDNLGSRYPVLSLLPSSEYCLAICVRAVVACVSAGLLGFNRSFFIGGGRSFVPAATWGFAVVYRWITADRDWVGNMADEG